MEFFNSAVDTLQTIVIGLGGALCVWGGVNLLEGYGQDTLNLDNQMYQQPVTSFQRVSNAAPLSEETKTAIQNTVLQFYVHSQTQEDAEGITACYERLSRDDERAGESLSIENQKRILEKYCRDHGYTAIRHYDEDDGFSGTNFAGVR